MPAARGAPAAALDKGFCSAKNLAAWEQRPSEPYIATSREPPQQSWQARCAAAPAPPAENARPQVKMAYKLRPQIGQAMYRLRKCTVEPGTPALGTAGASVGLSKAVRGFRQFSLRGLDWAAGEGCLVCLACNLKRRHTLSIA